MPLISSTSAVPTKLCAVDLETTGVDPLTARVVTASVVRIDPEALDGSASFNPDDVSNPAITSAQQWLADPGCEIPEAAAAVHGVTTEHARAHGRDHDDVVDEVVSEIERAWATDETVVVYNAPYDLSMLHVLSGGRFTVTGPVIDPLVLDKHADTYRRGSRKLVDVATHYGLDVDPGKAHSAEFDAMAAAGIALALRQRPTNRYGKQFDFPTTVGELMKLQTKASRKQFESLKKYLASKGTVISGSPGWPVADTALAHTAS